jgi:hypothetical protein
MNKSTYYWIGRLSPSEFCTDFNPGEIHLGNGWVLDIFQDGISIWIPGINKTFDKLKPLIIDAFEIIITSFMFITNKKLNFNLQSWVEAKGVVSKSNMIGFLIPPGAKEISPNPRSRASAAWRKAGRYYLKINNSFYHKLSLKDYKNCISTLGDDSFFFAYRIVEDIRKAVTQHLPDNLEEANYWNEMHKILGTSKKQIDPLTEAAKEVRHGNINSKIIVNARKKREYILSIAFNIMKNEFKRSFKGII